MGGRRLSDEDVLHVRGALAAGATRRDVAEEFGVCVETVGRIARRSPDRGRPDLAGKLVPVRWRLEPEDRREIVSLRAAGSSIAEIADQLGCVRSTVYYWLARADRLAEEAAPDTLRSRA